MKKILIASLLFALIGCKSTQKIVETPTEKIPEKPMQNQEPKPIAPEFLTGEKTMNDLQQAPCDVWFIPGYENYNPDQETIIKLKNLPEDITIKIVMGTWCEDSQNQVPRFYQILKQISFDLKKAMLITVDRSKTTPEHLEAGLNITNVPTFIIYKNEEEINRIVEIPVETLEKDLLKILSGQTYKHTYEK